MIIDLPTLTENLFKGLSEFLLDGKPLDKVAEENNLNKKDIADWENYLSEYLTDNRDKNWYLLRFMRDMAPEKDFRVHGTYYSHYPDRRFKETDISLLYRGSWCLSRDDINKIAFYSLFYDRIYVSAYMMVPLDDKRLIEDILFLMNEDILEPYSITYHNYISSFRMFLEEEDFPYKPIFEIMENQEKFLGKGFRLFHGPSRTKIYGRLEVIPEVVPLLTTAHDLLDKSLIDLIMGIESKLKIIRFGKAEKLYEIMLPIIKDLFADDAHCILEKYYPEEATIINKALSSLPLHVLDYVYYTNLTFYWMTIFRSTSFLYHIDEHSIYNLKLRKKNKESDIRPSAIDAYFSLPFFSFDNDLPINYITDIRKSKLANEFKIFIHKITSETKDLLKNKYSLKEIVEFLKDIENRVISNRMAEELRKEISFKQKGGQALYDIAVTLASIFFPPLAFAGLAGPAKAFYQLYNRDPIVLFTLKTQDLFFKSKKSISQNSASFSYRVHP